MNRRQFVLGGAAASGILKQAWTAPSTNSGKEKREQVGISTWSFHDLFATTRDKSSPPLTGKPFDLMDYPEMIADRYAVHHMEVVAPHFASTSASYLADFKKRLERAHSGVANIPVDIPELEQGAGLSDANEKVRATAISACKKWIDIAGTIGARSVRCDPGKINTSDLAPTISSYRNLASYAGQKGLSILIENHGGVGSEHPEELIHIFQEAGSHSGALPDFGNFPDEKTREKGLDLLFPFARTVCHVKDPRLGAGASGVPFDFSRCIAVSKRTGFKGIYSIEAEFGGDPYVSVGRLLDELVEHL